eukprot:gene29847-13134_t
MGSSTRAGMMFLGTVGFTLVEMNQVLHMGKKHNKPDIALQIPPQGGGKRAPDQARHQAADGRPPGDGGAADRDQQASQAQRDRHRSHAT